VHHRGRNPYLCTETRKKLGIFYGRLRCVTIYFNLHAGDDSATSDDPLEFHGLRFAPMPRLDLSMSLVNAIAQATIAQLLLG
jgi:hypothetical protein